MWGRFDSLPWAKTPPLESRTMGVMATAPTPIFATFGLLTAVMIALALAASLLVLRSLLVMAATRTETVEVHAEALVPAYAY